MKDQPLAAGGEVPQAATGRSPDERALPMSDRNGTSWSGRCEVLTNEKGSTRWVVTTLGSIGRR
jgi:hypothetical protein